ncbi:MAG: AIR synthase [Tissierellia bacterium]|nr:AIR synthase [Tissierellia bacterium]
MKIGKVPNSVLQQVVFPALKHKRDDIWGMPSIGEDTAKIDFGEELCILSVDPITGTSRDIGKLAVHISCNDIATAGAEPVGLLVTMLLPEGTTEEMLFDIMKQMNGECEKLNVSIIGGHTEVTNAVNRITLITTAIGRISKSNRLRTEDVKAGDVVLMSKWAALEGSWILSAEHKSELEKLLSADDRAKLSMLDEHISVVKEGILAVRHGAKYMHDITEGGLLGAIWEASEATGRGIEIVKDSIPILDETKRLLDHYPGVDPLQLISSGSMIIIMDSKDSDGFIAKANEVGINITPIGKVTDGSEAILLDGACSSTLSEPDVDALYAALKRFSN